MKSSYAIVGALELRKYVETLEEDCANNNIDISKFGELMDSILEMSPRLMKELEDILSHHVES